jgi:hypothetical protein
MPAKKKSDSLFAGIYSVLKFKEIIF